ncbi:Non-specific lipid-transfer protein [Quillaja saponaria]|uniref:Non-specific lipid-transfer protein n=1 Tax=Quillaja saponaria TaxID=32244 RepID=A0AAD7LKS2_QUISA|nr:Non-specific lipid-transfer protein [Quillaja saponaria]
MAKFAESRMAFTVVLACMLVAASHVDSATLTCAQVTVLLTPCISYAVYGGTVSPVCCQGIKTLNAAYKTAEDRRSACTCIRDTAATIPGINYERVNALGGICNSPCPFKVYPSTNCSKLN